MNMYRSEESAATVLRASEQTRQVSGSVPNLQRHRRKRKKVGLNLLSSSEYWLTECIPCTQEEKGRAQLALYQSLGQLENQKTTEEREDDLGEIDSNFI